MFLSSSPNCPVRSSTIGSRAKTHCGPGRRSSSRPSLFKLVAVALANEMARIAFAIRRNGPRPTRSATADRRANIASPPVDRAIRAAGRRGPQLGVCGRRDPRGTDRGDREWSPQAHYQARSGRQVVNRAAAGDARPMQLLLALVQACDSRPPPSSGPEEPADAIVLDEIRRRFTNNTR
jgi:hypothetical protein